LNLQSKHSVAAFDAYVEEKIVLTGDLNTLSMRAERWNLVLNASSS